MRSLLALLLLCLTLKASLPECVLPLPSCGARLEKAESTGHISLHYRANADTTTTIPVPKFANDKGTLLCIRYEFVGTAVFTGTQSYPVTPEGASIGSETTRVAFDLRPQNGGIFVESWNSTFTCHDGTPEGPNQPNLVCFATNQPYVLQDTLDFATEWNPALKSKLGEAGGDVEVTIRHLSSPAAMVSGGGTISGTLKVIYTYNATTSREYATLALAKARQSASGATDQITRAKALYNAAITFRNCYPGASVNENIRAVEYCARGAHGGNLNHFGYEEHADPDDDNDYFNSNIPIAAPAYEELKRLLIVLGEKIDANLIQLIQADDDPISAPGGTEPAISCWMCGMSGRSPELILAEYFSDNLAPCVGDIFESVTFATSPTTALLPKFQGALMVDAAQGVPVSLFPVRPDDGASVYFDPEASPTQIVSIVGLKAKSIVIPDRGGVFDTYSLDFGSGPIEAREGDTVELPAPVGGNQTFLLRNVTPDWGHLVLGLTFEGNEPGFVAIVDATPLGLEEIPIVYPAGQELPTSPKITGITATATSELTSHNRFAAHAVDGIYQDSNFWESVGTVEGFGTDRDPAITFDLQAIHQLDHLLIWNCHEPGPAIKRMFIEVSLDGVNFERLPGEFAVPANLAQSPTALPLGGWAARFVRFDILENYAGVVFPVVGNPAGWSLVGIDEVEFFGGLGAVAVPTITQSPDSLTVAAGQTAQFTVSATGTAPLVYQWRKGGVALSNGGNISGANTATLTLANVQADDVGSYNVAVSNPAGSKVSDAATLAVNASSLVADNFDDNVRNPSIWAESDRTEGGASLGETGQRLEYRVAIPDSAGGDEAYRPLASSLAVPADHDWEATVDLHNAAVAGNGKWASVGLALLSPDESRNVFLELYAADSARGFVTGLAADGEPVGTDGDTGNLGKTGGSARLAFNGTSKVVSAFYDADGSANGFQWVQLASYGLAGAGGSSGNDNWPLGSSDTLVLAVGGSSEGVTIAAGQAYLDNFTFAKESSDQAPTITSSPQSLTVVSGQPAQFTVTAAGTAPLAYHWRKGGVPLNNGGSVSGADTATLTLANAQAGDAGSYDVVVSNDAGTKTSEPATLTVQPTLVAPSISQQPASLTVTAGQAAQFTVTATGTAPLAYQWRKGGVALGHGGNISGANTATLTLANAQAGDAGSYDVVVSNAAGSKTSDPVTLTVEVSAAGRWLTGLTATATSELVSHGRNVANLTDGTFAEDGTATGLGSVWESSGIGFGSPQDDRAPAITFDFGGSYRIQKIRLWNFPEPPVAIRRVAIETSTDGTQFTFVQEAGEIAQGGQHDIALAAPAARYLRLRILENWGGVQGGDQYPVEPGTPIKGFAGFAGLLEARLYGVPTSSSEVAPAITQQPANATVTAGQPAQFTVTATGTAPLSYQWRKGGNPLANGGNISGADTASLTLSNAQAGDAGSFDVVVSNAAGTKTSDPATLTVVSALPTITQQPQSQSVVVGSPVTFSVGFHSAVGLTYQWLKNGEELPGKTTSQLQLTGVQFVDAGDYRLRISNGLASLLTDPATLTVLPPAVAPGFTQQPSNLTVLAGQTAQFTVNATGTAPLTYQWRKGANPLSNGGNISGADTAALVLANAQAGDAGSYEVVVSNTAGAKTSEPATLTVSQPAVAPSITQQPVNVTVTAGQAAQFTVVATGTAPLAYQWRKGANPLSNGGDISGVDTATLTLAAVQAGDAGSYDVVVSNAAGNETSDAATLTVQPSVVPQKIIGIVATATSELASHNRLASHAVDGIYCDSSFWESIGVGFGFVPDREDRDPAITFDFGQSVQLDRFVIWNGHENEAAIKRMVVEVSPDGVTFTSRGEVELSLPGGCPPIPQTVPLDGVTARFVRFDILENYAGVIFPVVGNPSGWSLVAIDEVEFFGGPGGVAVAPTITQAPANLTVTVGQSAQFTVTATGTAPLNYQWFKGGAVLGNGGNVSGVNTATLTLANVQSTDAGSYGVIVSNDAGSKTSESATLTVQPPAVAPTIVTPPANLTVAAGQDAFLAVTATGSAPLAYQWLFTPAAGGAEQALANANAATLTLAAVTPAHAGAYRVRISNEASPAGVFSQPATLTVAAVTGGFVNRRLPGVYVPGKAFEVVLEAKPAATIAFYAVADRPPTGWTVSGINESGVFDTRAGQVKFGPYADNAPRTLRFTVLPPGAVSGRFEFTGVASADGVETAVGGTGSLENAVNHPADLGADQRLAITEVTGYGAAWKRGEPWTLPPNPIPVNYVTRAGFLWRNGELYRLDPGAGAAPLWWVPDAANKPSVVRQTVTEASAATRTFAGKSVTVSAAPAETVSVYAVEERLFAGFTATDISHGGVFLPATGLVRWGPFFDHQVRELTYTVGAPANFEGEIAVLGLVSEDGDSLPVAGDSVLRFGTAELPPPVTPGFSGDSFKLDVAGPLNARVVIETSDSVGGGWTVATEFELNKPDQRWSVPVEIQESGKFFRVRVIVP